MHIFRIPKKENPVSSAQIPNMPPTIANCSVNDLGGVSRENIVIGNLSFNND